MFINVSKKAAVAVLVAAMVALSVPSAQAGRAGGGVFHIDRVNAGATDSYTVSFRGGELAQVIVVGDGDTDLDLYIYDENGNLVASDADYTDTCIAEWVPRWTGEFRVKIRNRGGVYNRYSLETN